MCLCMPLDKMSDSNAYLPTHKSIILHSNKLPVACIVEHSTCDKTRLLIISQNNSSIKASLIGFLNKHEDLGLLMGFKLKIQSGAEFFEYTVYPCNEFIDTVILDEEIVIINEELEPIFILEKIMTDQFVKTKSEFDKFNELLG